MHSRGTRSSLDQQRGQDGEGKKDEWDDEGVLHGVDVAADEDLAPDRNQPRLHVRREVGRQRRAGLSDSDLKAFRGDVAEGGDELIAE